MANIANNESLVIFEKDVNNDAKRSFIKDFEEIFEIYNDTSYDIEKPANNIIELSYGSRWDEQRDKLEKLSNKHKVIIIGVCYEFGCLYVNHFEINEADIEIKFN